MWAKRFALPLLLFLGASAQKPNVKTTRFENLPKNMFYFEDAVLYHDSAQANVYLSEDEGKNWSKVKGVPDGHALVLVQHPFNNRMVSAFILGDKVTHWRTMDRGRMWQSFEMPHPIAFVPAPLSFHSDEKNSEWIMMQVCTHTNDSNVLHSLALAPTLALTLAPKVRECKKSAWGWSETCFGSTYYTLDAFSSGAKLLTRNSFKCIFAHSSSIRTISSGSHKKIGFAPKRPPSQVFCVAFDKNAADGSTNACGQSVYFIYGSNGIPDRVCGQRQETELIDFGLGQRASRGVTAIGIMSKFMVAALRDPSGKSHELQLQVTLDGHTWHKAQFPHASSSKLLENAYTIVESTSHSLAVDVLLHSDAAVGTLFVSNSNGTFFVESLVDTNRNRAGFVDFEDLVGVEGVGIANYVKNAPAVEGHKAAKQSPAPWVADVWAGRTWDPLDPPDDSDCRSGSRETCALHLYSVSTPHNIGKVFSSPAPGLVLGVGSVGTHLRPYEECDTYMSRDAGLTWKRVQKGAHMYEVGDQGAVTVLVDDEEYTKQTVDLGVEIRARVLTTVPDSTSLTFILLGSLSREDAKGPGGRYVAIHLDFEPAKVRKCESDDFEKWYNGFERLSAEFQLMGGGARSNGTRGERKTQNVTSETSSTRLRSTRKTAPVKMKIMNGGPIVSDYNYIRQNNQCVAAGPEPIPVDVCKSNSRGEKYLGSSGYRLIPGNTCDRDKGIKKDEKIQKDCSEAQKPPGEVSHQVKFFKRPIVGNWHFQKAGTILVQLDDGTVHQSSNEGYSWTQLVNGEYIIAVYMHLYADDRAYLITNKDKLYYTTDTAQQWLALDLPAPPNQFGLGLLSFHPLQSDWLIYTGQTDCGSDKSNCHVEAYYTLNHGRTWTSIEKYVKTCTWARTANLRIDQHLILCESYRDKKGNQLSFANNPLEFIEGSEYFKNKRKMFDNVVGFAKFSEYLLVAEVSQGAIQRVGSPGFARRTQFCDGKIPPWDVGGQPCMRAGSFVYHLLTHSQAYTVLESSTDSVFLHVTMSDKRGAEWGNVLKSNSNGTYYGLSLEAVNRNAQGYVDFEKLVGLDGINCALHIHGYTERYDARAKYSSPSAIGLMMGVGSVSEHLAPYKDSDTFLSRDGGFTWEEVHKDAHLFSFGDSGSVIVIVNDEEPTDHVLYTTNEGTSWREYKFSDERLRIRSIVTKPTETSLLNPDDPNKDDFELWSPSEEREERCLFGRQVCGEYVLSCGHLFLRRFNIIDDCGIVIVMSVTNPRLSSAFEFNYVRNSAGDCVLTPGAEPLPNDDTCPGDASVWYERTAYRKIPHSSCEGGDRKDRGPEHPCPGIGSHGYLFWGFVVMIPIIFAGLVGLHFKKHGFATGAIRLPDNTGRQSWDDGGIVSTLASIPVAIVAVSRGVWARVSTLLPGRRGPRYPTRGGYRTVAVDEDAQVLRFEDDD
ncbi:signal sequence binding protein [Rhizoctonia solani AG-1 IA]|uniref:Signal sequence binding protein n=1 Tax=Thanatephorus cucumeris (strain AG1-IA) TaxID=983506 RepID=L8X582_THACA|nr:signal sequence binding protein [Rhizoctonia solani AG-1 IA]